MTPEVSHISGGHNTSNLTYTRGQPEHCFYQKLFWDNKGCPRQQIIFYPDIIHPVLGKKESSFLSWVCLSFGGVVTLKWTYWSLVVVHRTSSQCLIDSIFINSVGKMIDIKREWIFLTFFHHIAQSALSFSRNSFEGIFTNT